ncbi:MAG: FxsA family protein [Deltaproteobacteria bacterium]|nr:MAG: FxsA family protein [Deltaproteobacteria bacterium]
MFTRLLILFLAIPALEIYTLLEAGRILGVLPTICLILATGVAGAWLAKSQGLDLVVQIQKELAEGRVPTDKLLDGALILAGGLTLLTPGFWTDLLGFLCLAPGTRIYLKRQLQSWFEKQVATGNIRIYRP